MKASFFHDTPLIRDTDGKIYSRSFSYDIWERYLSVFDSLIISTRMKEGDSTKYNIKHMKLSSGENVNFQPISAYNKNIDLLINYNKIKKEIRRTLTQADCAIIRLPSFIGNIAYKEANKMNKPSLIEVVGCAWDAYWNYSLIGKFVALPSYLAMKKAVKDAKYATYVTNKFLQTRYPTTGEYTNCSNVYINNINKNIMEKRFIKIKRMDKSNKIVLGTAAAVNVRYKGQQYVIKALGRLKKQGITNIEYQLVGAGDQSYLRSVAEKYDVAKQVNFLGPMQHDKVFEWLDTIDIYVQPSRQEGLPRALIEAMSRGVPAFGARTAGIPELLEDEFLFSNTRNNIDEICAILKKFNNQQNMITQSKRNFEEAKKYHKDIIEERRQRILNQFKNSIDV